MARRFCRRPEVSKRTGLPRSTLYKRIREGDFPEPVKLGPNSVAWREEDIEDWMASRPSAREGGQ